MKEESVEISDKIFLFLVLFEQIMNIKCDYICHKSPNVAKKIHQKDSFWAYLQ